MRNMRELGNYMERRYNVPFAEGMEKMDFEAVMGMMVQAEKVLHDFPALQDQVKGMSSARMGEGAYASADLNGRICMNPERIPDRAALMRDYARDVAHGYHPRGSDGSHLLVHELGHQMEAALVNRRYGSGTYAANRAWRKCTVSGEIVAEAMTRLDANWRSHGKETVGRISQVSGYARRNPSETLAECMVDVYANGRRASPLSKAVFSITKERLGGIR